MLDAVRKATIAERGKDVRADVEIVESILALNNAEARSELLRLHVERLSRQPGRMRAFSSVVANICDNLLDENAETRPPPELVEKLGDLRSGLMALAPAVADSAGGWMAEVNLCILCFSRFAAGVWFGPGSRRGPSETAAHSQSVHNGSLWMRSVGSRSGFSRLVSYRHASSSPSGEQGDISIRGARHDRIAAHKLNRSCQKALQLTRQR